MERVAVLGAGFMGSAAAERLTSRGFRVIIWNRTKSRAVEVASSVGAEAADTVSEALSKASHAIAFLSDDDALISVASQMGRSDGLVFINSSTITPKTSTALRDHMSRLGACYVEAPVVGGPSAVRRGGVIALVAGDGHCVEQASPVIDAISSKVIRLGRVGEASALKLAYNNLLMATLASLSESLVLARLYGVPEEKFEELVYSTSFSEVARRYLDRITGRDRVVSFRLRLAAKDAYYASQALNSAGAPSFIASQVSQLFRAASQKYGDSDYSRIYEFLEEVSGLKEGG